MGAQISITGIVLSASSPNIRSLVLLEGGRKGRLGMLPRPDETRQQKEKVWHQFSSNEKQINLSDFKRLPTNVVCLSIIVYTD